MEGRLPQHAVALDERGQLSVELFLLLLGLLQLEAQVLVLQQAPVLGRDGQLVGLLAAFTLEYTFAKMYSRSSRLNDLKSLCSFFCSA